MSEKKLYPISILAVKGHKVSHLAVIFRCSNADEVRGKALRLAYKTYPLSEDYRYDIAISAADSILDEPEDANIVPGQ